MTAASGRPVRHAGIALVFALVAGCAGQKAPAPLPRPTAPAAPETPPIVASPAGQIAGFTATPQALEAFRRACPRLLKREDASGLTRPADWQAACADSSPDPAAFFARHFTPVILNDGKGLATGYFEPEIAGLRPPAPGAAPVLSRPPELVDLNLKDWNISGGTIRGLVKGNRVVRAPDRAAIESGAFAGVTAALRVNASVHSPLLCVVNVFKVASGDLSLPGKVNR